MEVSGQLHAPARNQTWLSSL